MTEPSMPPVYFLLVDDLDENLIALEILLRREGLGLLKAKSGPDALDFLRTYEVALALVDAPVPGMDCLEFAERVHGTERTRCVPILFLTAESTALQRRFRGYQMGAVDFLQKPIEPEILKSKADVFFELDRQRQQVARQRNALKAINDENARLLEKSRQHAEALEKAYRRKDEFLATLAHELRNPLAPILSAIEVLRLTSPVQDGLQELMDIIERQASHLIRLVDGLSDVSRIARGKIELQRARIALHDVVHSAIETNKPLIEAKKHELSVHLPPKRLEVDGDLERLTQVLANLLNNAATYTPEGGRIALHVNEDRNVAVITVNDNGLGIPDDMLGEVFEMFSQAKQHRSSAHGGLGIGLTLAKSLVEMHGGTIEVHSDGPGQGAEFTVRLPLAATVPQPSIPNNAASRMTASK